MPFTLAEAGEENIIKRIGGKQEVKSHLEILGFVAGDSHSGNCCGRQWDCECKKSRVAVSREMAQKIMI